MEKNYLGTTHQYRHVESIEISLNGNLSGFGCYVFQEYSQYNILCKTADILLELWESTRIELKLKGV